MEFSLAGLRAGIKTKDRRRELKKTLRILSITAFVLICGNILWNMSQGEVLNAILYLGFLLLYMLSLCLIELADIAWQLRERRRDR